MNKWMNEWFKWPHMYASMHTEQHIGAVKDRNIWAGTSGNDPMGNKPRWRIKQWISGTICMDEGKWSLADLEPQARMENYGREQSYMAVLGFAAASGH